MVLMSGSKPTEKQLKWGELWCTVVDYVPEKPRRTAWHRAYDSYFERFPYDPKDFSQDQDMEDEENDLIDLFNMDGEQEPYQQPDTTTDDTQQQSTDQWLNEMAQDTLEHNEQNGAKARKTYLEASASGTRLSAWHQGRKDAYEKATLYNTISRATLKEKQEDISEAAASRAATVANEIAQAAAKDSILAREKHERILEEQHSNMQAQHAEDVAVLKRQIDEAAAAAKSATQNAEHNLKSQIDAAVAAARAATQTAEQAKNHADNAPITDQKIIKDATDKFHEQDKKYEEFMKKMKAMDQQVRIDQNEIRDKMKIQADIAHKMMEELNGRFQGIYNSITAQGEQINALSQNVADLNNRFSAFLDKQVNTMAAQEVAAAATAKRQDEIVAMLVALQNRDPEGQPAPKHTKVSEKS